MRSATLTSLRDRRQTDEMIRALGGVIQGRNVVFKAGPQYDKASDVLKLPSMPKRPTREEEIKAWLIKHGPVLWRKIHVGLLTVELSRETVDALINGVVRTLPCGECKSHARKYIKENQPPITDRRALLDWGYDFHDNANEHAKHPIIGRIVARKIWET